MGVKSKVLGVASAAAGVAGAAAAARMINQRAHITHRDVGDDTPLGSVRSAPITVVADDGLRLHAEIDEPENAETRPPVTVVYIHGFSLNLDCWHFQRAGYRGLLRSVFYDQRSHGRTQRSSAEHCNIEQLGTDLVRVLDDLTGDDRVVLVGHSMGGMTIMSLAEQRPDLFGSKIVGVALIATTAGGLDPGRILFPMLPAGIGGGVIDRLVSTLSRGSSTVDRLRRFGHDVASAVIDAYAFGSDVPQSYVDFVYGMLDMTPFAVVADFFPAFAAMNKWEHLEPLARIPTALICGTGDKITAIGHSRKLHARIQGSDLLECEGAGHMVIIERHSSVNDELDSLFDRSVEYALTRPWEPRPAGQLPAEPA